MVMKRFKDSNTGRVRHRLSRPSRPTLPQVISQFRQTLRYAHKDFRREPRVSGREYLPIEEILLALGYESQLVRMLRRRKGR